MTEARLRGLPCKSSAAWTPPLTIHSCGHMQVVLIESWWLIDIYKQGPNEPKDNTSHLCTCVTDTCDQHLGKDSQGRAWAAMGKPNSNATLRAADVDGSRAWDPVGFCRKVFLRTRRSATAATAKSRELRTQHLVSERCLASGPGSHLSGAVRNRRQSMCLVEKNMYIKPPRYLHIIVIYIYIQLLDWT